MSRRAGADHWVMRTHADHDTRTFYVAAAEVLDLMPERVIRFSVPSLVVSYCNAAWGEGHNVEPSEVIGHRLDEFLSAPELVGVDYQLGRLGPDHPILADDHARPAPDATGQWMEWVDRYMWTPNGAEVIAVGRDVTARYIAELSLAESEARFRNLADRSADVVWRFVLDPLSALRLHEPVPSSTSSAIRHRCSSTTSPSSSICSTTRARHAIERAFLRRASARAVRPSLSPQEWLDRHRRDAVPRSSIVACRA